MFQLLCLTLCSQMLFALPDRSHCTARDLQRQDCRLQQAPWNFQLSNKTVSWTDGVWKEVSSLVLSGDGLTWEKAQLKLIHKRVFLEMWIWDVGVGEGKVQSLHWFVYEFANQQMKNVVNEVVRKRHPEPVIEKNSAKKSDIKSNKDPTADVPKIKYVLDPMDAHQLTEGSKGKVKWSHLKKTVEF